MRRKNIVRVTFTIEADEEFRRALNWYLGREGLADRGFIVRRAEEVSMNYFSDIVEEYRSREE